MILRPPRPTRTDTPVPYTQLFRSQRGANLLASERQEHRAGLVRRATRTSTAGLLGVVVADGTRPAWAPGSFDRVIVDAPCSGLGALRRRPESRWRRSPKDIAELVPLQTDLPANAPDSVRPGGVVADEIGRAHV